MEQNYRPKEASKMLGIGLSTFWLRVKEGKIIPQKLSQRTTIVGAKALETASKSLTKYEKIKMILNQKDVKSILSHKQCIQSDSNTYFLANVNNKFIISNEKIRDCTTNWSGDIVMWLMEYCGSTFEQAVSEVAIFKGVEYE